MFRDEGSEPSIEFKKRMAERVGRTPTSLLLVALPFLIAARLFVFSRSYYLRVRCHALSERIDSTRDLRTLVR